MSNASHLNQDSIDETSLPAYYGVPSIVISSLIGLLFLSLTEVLSAGLGAFVEAPVASPALGFFLLPSPRHFALRGTATGVIIAVIVTAVFFATAAATAATADAPQLLEQIFSGLPVSPLVHEFCAARPRQGVCRPCRPRELPVRRVEVVEIAPTPLQQREV